MSKPERNKKWKRIGKNIMAIKEANGMTTKEFAALFNNRIADYKFNRAKSGFDSFTDQEIFLIASRTGISEKDIVDLETDDFIEKNNLYKNSKTYRSGKTIMQLIASNELSDFQKNNSELFSKSFLFLDDKQSLKVMSFCQAQSLLEQFDFCDKDVLNEIISLFEESINDGASAVAYANILSTLGVFSVIGSLGMDKDELLEYLGNKPLSELDTTLKLVGKMKPDVARKRKNNFFEEYGDLYYRCFDALFESKKYKDLGDFLWLVMYMFNVAEEAATELTDEERVLIAKHLLIFLIFKGNKYALKIID